MKTLSNSCYPCSSSSQGQGPAVVNDDQWSDAVMRAQTRQDKECPICMGDFMWCDDDDGGNDGNDGENESVEVNGGAKRVVILSCSHLYHDTCLSAFECFSAYQQEDGIMRCPVCRNEYCEKATYF